MGRRAGRKAPRATADRPRRRGRRFVEVDERKIGKRIHGIPVVSHDEGLRVRVALGAVAGEAARARLRELAHEQGRREGHHFVAVA